jgi:hypothetical protein
MRVRTMYLLTTCVLLATTLAAEPNYPSYEGGVLLDPAHEVSPAVDRLIRDYKPGMDTSALNGLTGFIRAYSGALRLIGDCRIVKPYMEWLSDTVRLPDEARGNMLHTLGLLGDVAAAKVVMTYATDTTMSPRVRYEAATALCLLGNAETGTQVLKNLALTNALPLNHFPPLQFLGSGWAPVKLRSAADEEALTLYMRWLAERGTDEYTISSSVTYLLQKDEGSRDFAFRIAERALQSPDVYLSGENAKHAFLSCVARFGGERGKALAAKYAK